MRFNILLTTIGRPSLVTMLDSIIPQLSEEDIVTVVIDGMSCYTDTVKAVTKTHSRCKFLVNHSNLGHWGHASRNKFQNGLQGDFIINADDDDTFLPDAMEKIRKHCTEEKLYIFQMNFNGTLIPKNHKIEFANIGTPCGVIPNTQNLPDWWLRYGGDFDFYNALSKQMDYEFIDEVIYKVR